MSRENLLGYVQENRKFPKSIDSEIIDIRYGYYSDKEKKFIETPSTINCLPARYEAKEKLGIAVGD